MRAKPLFEKPTIDSTLPPFGLIKAINEKIACYPTEAINFAAALTSLQRIHIIVVERQNSKTD